MRIDLGRLRSGELLTAAAVVAMLVSLFALRWYGAGPGGLPARDGWQGATHLHWLLVVATAVGAATVVTQAACRGPALPSALDALSTVIALPALVWLLFRVVIDPGAHQQAGAWVGLAAGAGLLAGSFVSLRQEGILDRDGPQQIPLVELPEARPAGPAA